MLGAAAIATVPTNAASRAYSTRSCPLLLRINSAALKIPLSRAMVTIGMNQGTFD
jgi:hypothetical protein